MSCLVTSSHLHTLSVSTCDVCGAAVPEGLESCQSVFDEVLAREQSDFRYAKRHRLMVDTYALQHPEAYMQSGKSFVAHLTGVCAALERDDAPATNRAVQQWLNGPRIIKRPSDPPMLQRGALTITYLRGATTPEDHLQRVLEWARSTWQAWSAHHDLARQWIEVATGATE